MSQGNDFANYAASAEDRSSGSEDVWFVAVASDDIKQMTIDQLDEAFRLGVITAETAVWTDGMEAWAPLGEVADLDSEEASGEHEAAPAPFAAALESAHAEVAQAHREQRDAHQDSLPSQRRTNPGWHNPFEPPVAESVPPTMHSMGHPSRGPSSFAPVTASYAPPAGGMLGQSTGPVALNVDEDMPPVSRGRRFRPERWLLAAAGIVAVGVVAFNNRDVFSSASSSVAAAEKQASAAALVARPYEVGADKSEKAKADAPAATAPSAAPSADDDKDAPIGSLKGEKADEDAEEAAPAAKSAKEAPSAKEEAAAKDSDSKESLRGGFAKAFSKTAPGAKPAKAAKPAKPARAAKLARKAPSRAPAKGKKPGVARAASAFDPLNGSLP
jgi:hypothetical protein